MISIVIISVDFDLIFGLPMFPLFLRLPDRKVIYPNGPYISMSQTKIGYVCLSVITDFFSVIVCPLYRIYAYINLSRGFKLLPKIQNFIQNYSNGTDFFFSRFFVWASRKQCLMPEKSITKMNGIWKDLDVLMICQMYLQVMKSPWVCFWYFQTLLTIIHVWIVVSPPNIHRLCAS